jgi:hypothetical protein
MIWGRRFPIHGERAKPLDKAAAAAHVDCCVLCVCLRLCFVCGSNFNYHTGRKSTSAKAKWPIFVHSYHKTGPQTPQAEEESLNFNVLLLKIRGNMTF